LGITFPFFKTTNTGETQGCQAGIGGQAASADPPGKVKGDEKASERIRRISEPVLDITTCLFLADARPATG